MTPTSIEVFIAILFAAMTIFLVLLVSYAVTRVAIRLIRGRR